MPCRSGLTGTFCRQCNQSTFYYVAAEQGTAAHCEPCENAVSNGLSSIVTIMLIVCLVLLVVCTGVIRCAHSTRVDYLYTVASGAVKDYTLMSKFKILVGFVE